MAQGLVPSLAASAPPSPHLLGVAGRDLLEALAGLPESHILSTELLLQELLGVGRRRGRWRPRDLVRRCGQRDWDRKRAQRPSQTDRWDQIQRHREEKEAERRKLPSWEKSNECQKKAG